MKGSRGYFKVLLTGEQTNDTNLLEHNLQWDIGFLPPERVPSYHCNKCAKDINHPPEISVTIDQDGIGVSTMVYYKCTLCNELLLGSLIKSPEGIDPKYIRFDKTGDYKTPTMNDIEEQMKIALDAAKDADITYKGNLKIALNWTEKISHEIPRERIKEMAKTYWISYLQSLKDGLPDLVDEIKARSYMFNAIETDGEGEVDSFHATGLYQSFHVLEKTLSHTDLPDDVGLKQDILRILVTNKEMFEESVACYEEKKRELDESIEAEQKRAEGAQNKIDNFLDKSGLTEDQKQGAMEPLSRDYGS